MMSLPQRVQISWLPLGPAVEMTWLALRAISVLFGINGVRNKQCRCVGRPFLVFKACFSAMAGWHFL